VYAYERDRERLEQAQNMKFNSYSKYTREIKTGKKDFTHNANN